MTSIPDLRQRLALQKDQDRGSTVTLSVQGASPNASIRPLKSIPSQAPLDAPFHSHRAKTSSTRSVASSSHTTTSTETNETVKPIKNSTYNYTLSDLEESAVLSAAYRAVNRDCKKTDNGVKFGICRVLAGKQRSGHAPPSLNRHATITNRIVDDAVNKLLLDPNEHLPPPQIPPPIPSDPFTSVPPIPPILLLTAKRISSLLLLSPHLYFLAPSDTRGGWNGIVLVGSEANMAEVAVEGLKARFGRRLRFAELQGGDRVGTAEGGRRKEDKSRVWKGYIDGLDGWGLDDEEAIWGVLGRAAVSIPPSTNQDEDEDYNRNGAVLRKVAEPPKPVPPAGSIGIEEMVRRARKKFVSLSPKEAWEELRQPLPLPDSGKTRLGSGIDVGTRLPFARYLIDLRRIETQSVQGRIPNALSIPLSLLETSLDPRLPLQPSSSHSLLSHSKGRLSIATSYDTRYILISEDGFSSALAVVRLMEMGLWNCTDILGGFEAWRVSEVRLGVYN